MTILEQFKLDKPDLTNADVEYLRSLSCPDDYSYLHRPDNCPLNRKPIQPCSAQICIDCWNREMPEPDKGGSEQLEGRVTSNASFRDFVDRSRRNGVIVDKEKETTMTNCKETQCTRCIHREVCALKEDFLAACDATWGFTYTRKDGGMMRIVDTPFISPIELQCKYYQQIINTRNGLFDVTNLCGDSDATSTSGNPNANYILRG